MSGNRRPKLGIALGSGSARGWAHIGVLRALAERNIAPDFVAGSSMGAMIGAVFAAGRIDDLEKWAVGLDWKRVVGLLDVGFRGGLIKGDRLLTMFYSHFVKVKFSELPLPFAAVATDLATGEEVWLREGSVSEAVRASCTVPGLFRPVQYEGRFLVDGGIVNPVPVSLCRAMGAEIVIAVDLTCETGTRVPVHAEERSTGGDRRRGVLDFLGLSMRGAVPTPALADTFLGAIDIMQRRIAQARLVFEPPDVLVQPRLGSLNAFEYHRAALAIAEGREAVAKLFPDIDRALGM